MFASLRDGRFQVTHILDLNGLEMQDVISLHHLMIPHPDLISGATIEVFRLDYLFTFIECPPVRGMQGLEGYNCKSEMIEVL